MQLFKSKSSEKVQEEVAQDMRPKEHEKSEVESLIGNLKSSPKVQNEVKPEAEKKQETAASPVKEEEPKMNTGGSKEAEKLQVSAHQKEESESKPRSSNEAKNVQEPVLQSNALGEAKKEQKPVPDGSKPVVQEKPSCDQAMEKIPITVRKDQSEEVQLSHEEKKRIYTLIFKYRFLSFAQICSILGTQKAEKLAKNMRLEIVESSSEKFFFCSKESIEEFASLTGDSAKDLMKEPVFSQKIKEEDKQFLPGVKREIDILLALEKTYEEDGKCQLYDWVSANNPMKKRWLSMKRCDVSRGSLDPDFLAVLNKKGQRLCLIFVLLPAFHAYMAGEKVKKYWDSITAYNAWLSKEELVEKWIRRLKLYLAVSDIGAAFVLPNQSQDVIPDLLAKMESEGVVSPIYLGIMEEVLGKPLACWYANNTNGFLKTRKYGKSQ